MKTALLALCLLLAAAPGTCTAGASATGPSAAQPKHPALPDSAAGRVLADWLDAFNSGELAPLQRFHAAHPRADASAQDELDWRLQTGGFEPVAIEVDLPHRAVVLVRDRDSTDERVRVGATVDAVGRATVETQALDVPRRTLPGALSGLAAELDRLAAERLFSGAVLVARDGDVLLRTAHAVADRGAGAPVTPDTRFRVASVNKMFTAVAALQLVDAGKLALDAPIGRVLPDYPDRDVAATVTLRQLLSHRSGLADMAFGTDEGMTPAAWIPLRDQLRTHTDYLARYGPQAPVARPGEKTAYNNFGFMVVGAMIERASGMDYYEYVDAHVLRPAGMASTGFAPEAEIAPRLASGYTLRDGAWVSIADTLFHRGFAAGGGYSTVDDLHRFALALQDGTLLSPAMLAEATRPQIPEGWYGLGFIVVGDGPLRRFGHGGDAPGMGADVRIFPESGYVLVALSNIDPPANYRPFRWFEPRMPLERAAARTATAR
ncbi:serine hydrolase domain-containing protein [Cognatilysobacter tabacisoli]|uniref:serine hydrolase domain-containing protein n=1 Tax=Cognatilysobacter tabacisoli TaxID=2315424 RepID=UPI000E6B00CF|nr:serine hydrolase domain-containing protein [Lysobacter tabacisoli]